MAIQRFFFLGLVVVLCLLFDGVAAKIVLLGKNVSLSFDDMESNFAPSIKGSGICGALYTAEPLDACSSLTNKIDGGVNSPFALISRGGCTFDEKVRKAQNAGFKAAIVYDDEDGGALVPMAGNSDGIKIPAVFVSKASGEMLKKYADVTPMELWIIPTFENSAWSIMAISFISLLAMSAVLATCFFVRRQRVRRERSRTPRVREFYGMSDNSVKAMPSLIFTSALEDNCTSTTCAICLEDYNMGEKLRVLPCRHKFHAFCVDSWLTSWRSFCPICKRDARTSTGDPPPSESTPLLLSRPSSPSTSHALSSFRSSISSSPPIQIIPRPPRAPSISASPAVNIAPSISHSPSSFRTHSYSSTPHAHSYSSTPHAPHLLRSYGNSPAMVHSRSTADFRSASSHRSRDSFLVPSHSFGVPYSSSPLSRYPSPYAPSYLGSSSREQQLLLHYSRSNASTSPFASGHSLPGC